jgi:hypothetical protein
MSFKQSDALLVGLAIFSVLALSGLIAFLVLWRITVEDRDAVYALYDECAGLDEE